MASIYEFLYPTEENQTKFFLENKIKGVATVYKNGSNPINFVVGTEVVYENNKEVEKEYIEVEPLNMDDYLIVQTTTNMLVTGNYKNVLFKQYGSDQRLLYNQRYTINIEDDPINVNLSFTSRYDPLYCSAKLVREDVSPVVTLPEDDINFIIYTNSLKILTETKGNGDLNYDMPTPYILSKPASIPYNIQMRVRYMSDIDILYAVYMKMTGQYGSFSKKLGNMSIDRQVRIPYLKDFLSVMRQKLAQYETMRVASAVKGELFEPYPITPQRRSF